MTARATRKPEHPAAILRSKPSPSLCRDAAFSPRSALQSTPDPRRLFSPFHASTSPAHPANPLPRPRHSTRPSATAAPVLVPPLPLCRGSHQRSGTSEPWHRRHRAPGQRRGSSEQPFRHAGPTLPESERGKNSCSIFNPPSRQKALLRLHQPHKDIAPGE